MYIYVYIIYIYIYIYLYIGRHACESNLSVPHARGPLRPQPAPCGFPTARIESMRNAR